jgi:FkbM family methyltransferase
MPRARNWIGDLLLHSPQSLRSLRNVPVLGTWIHKLSHSVLPDGEKVWARIESGPAKGIWIEVNPRTGQAYVRGDAEPRIQKVLAERLKPGDIFFDLGANIGLFTLLAARIVGATGEVFSFEPDSQNAARLRRNVERNQFANVTIIEAGVWSSTGKLNFLAAEATSPDRGVGTFMQSGPSEELNHSGTLASCVALDDFARTAPPPTAIKCDVEGAELEFLRGAQATVQKFRPWIICEMHSKANDRAARELLSQWNYKLESLDETHVLATAP